MSTCEDMLSVTNDDLVFSTLDGKPLRPNTVARAWGMLAARVGVKVIRFHDARHTRASVSLKLGLHPKIVQERLGIPALPSPSTPTPMSRVDPRKRQQDALTRHLPSDTMGSPKSPLAIHQQNWTM